ncbi:hypothetical protein O6H91_06G073300 [Diphasiastrum complanatum]|uniref:Uncharacterized protein n=1 Tax=Diphasiastrum complanatum TaxID=34168 RepID=A0ACC2DFG1_DIPCM|nr:hypothetical protein O6H91_06G073300 [Diphasiastrum complanatum]
MFLDVGRKSLAGFDIGAIWQARAWLKVWISVRTALSATSYISKVRNKHAILVGLATIAAVIFTWKSHRSRKLKPCPAPQEIKDHASKGMLLKSLQESVAPTAPTSSQLDGDENILPVQQDLHVTHFEAAVLSSAQILDMATGNKDILSSECADVKETFVFDKRQLEDSTRGPENYRILYPVSTLSRPQPFDIGEQGDSLANETTMIIPTTESDHREAPSQNGFLKTGPLMNQTGIADSQKKFEFGLHRSVIISNQNDNVRHDNMYEVKSDRNLEDQLLDMHHKDQKEDSKLYEISNSIENENVEFRNKTLDICNEPPAQSKCRNVSTSSWKTPLEIPSDMTSSDFSPGDVTTTIQNFPRSNFGADAMALSKTTAQLYPPVMEAGMHRPFLCPLPHNENRADISCTGQSSVPTEVNPLITNFQDIKSHSVPIMVGEHTNEGFQYENNVPLSRSMDDVESLHGSVWYDSELSRISPFSLAHKLERSIPQGPDMYKLIHSTGDVDRSDHNVRLSQGSYQEKLHTYDKYLADPKLSAQMRSQVQRAKVYLQRYYELDGQ